MGGSNGMSASAGRVLLIPKGDYNPSTTYTMLDEVFYQGSSYVCKKTSLGNAPTNTEYWQIMSQGLLAGNFYGTCSTGASTAEKEVVIPSGEHFSLQLGDIIGVKFTYTNTAISPELNVNDTGAKHIYYNNATVSSEKLWAGGEADRITLFQYDGTNWVWVGHDVDEHIENASELGIGIGTSSTAESTIAKEATLADYEAMTNGVVAVRFTYAVPANSTLNINSKGAKAIYYKNSAIVANVIKAGDTVTFFYDGTYYHIVSIDRSEGHVVQDADGTSMTNRGKLQFPDSLVSDDSTNDRTVVEVMQEPMSREDFEDAVSLEDGIYPITTDDNTIISSDMVKHESGTVEDKLNELDGRMVTTTTSGSTTASGNIVANAPAGNVFPITSKLTSPVDCYVIPYWLTGGNMWAFRVKQADDSALTSTAVTIETIWVKL